MDRPQLTDLLLRAGDDAALDAVLPVVYEELRRIAHRQLQRENEGHTFQTTALVHEAYVRLVDQTRVQWRDRAHFLAIAAIAMRRILVDHARRRGRVKRGGSLRRVALDALDLPAEDRADLLQALDEALERLSVVDPRAARVVECRFFGGMTEPEAAAALGIGVRTVARDWERARSWLFQEIYPDAVG